MGAGKAGGGPLGRSEDGERWGWLASSTPPAAPPARSSRSIRLSIARAMPRRRNGSFTYMFEHHVARRRDDAADPADDVAVDSATYCRSGARPRAHDRGARAGPAACGPVFAESVGQCPALVTRTIFRAGTPKRGMPGEAVDHQRLGRDQAVAEGLEARAERGVGLALCRGSAHTTNRPRVWRRATRSTSAGPTPCDDPLFVAVVARARARARRRASPTAGPPLGEVRVREAPREAEAADEVFQGRVDVIGGRRRCVFGGRWTWAFGCASGGVGNLRRVGKVSLLALGAGTAIVAGISCRCVAPRRRSTGRQAKREAAGIAFTRVSRRTSILAGSAVSTGFAVAATCVLQLTRRAASWFAGGGTPMNASPYNSHSGNGRPVASSNGGGDGHAAVMPPGRYDDDGDGGVHARGRRGQGPGVGGDGRTDEQLLSDYRHGDKKAFARSRAAVPARAVSLPRALPRQPRGGGGRVPGDVPPGPPVGRPVRPAAAVPPVAVHDRGQQGPRPDPLPGPPARPTRSRRPSAPATRRAASSST